MAVALLLISACNSETPESLAADFRQQLKRGGFWKIYDEASEHVHINVSREKFIKRAEKIVNKLENVDENFNWRQNDIFEEPADITT